MFVTKTKYNEVKLKKDLAEAELSALIESYNVLVRKIKRGDFSQRYVLPTEKSSEFTQEELAKLIRLCHPDKHNGSSAANEMTLKLLKLRK